MANKIKFKKINLDFVKSKYPVLFNTLESIEGLDDRQKELVAGLSIEIMLKCNGTPEIFEDELSDLEFLNEDY